MGIIPGQLIPGPEPLRRRYGLFTAASGPIDLPSPHGRGGGVRYVPVTCGEAHPYPIGCYGGEVNPPAEGKTIDAENEEVQAPPFMVVASIECGALGYTAPEFEAKVRRRLASGEQGAAELALWSGVDPNGNSLDIPYLTDSAETIPAADYDENSLASVIGVLEEYAYHDQGYGYTAFLHAPVSIASWAVGEGDLARPDGPLLRTPFGSIWVFGGGYPNDGSIYITGQVNVWRSADEHVYPTDQTMDRETNQRLLIAEREYAVGFDCFAAGVEFVPPDVSPYDGFGY